MMRARVGLSKPCKASLRFVRHSNLTRILITRSLNKKLKTFMRRISKEKKRKGEDCKRKKRKEKDNKKKRRDKE